MFTQVNEKLDDKIENEGKLRKTFETAGKVAEVALDIELIKKRVGNAVENAVIDAQRRVKHGRYAVEDLIDDTSHRIKKAPWRSIGIALGAGIGFGMIAGWLMTHRAAGRDEDFE